MKHATPLILLVSMTVAWTIAVAAGDQREVPPTVAHVDLGRYAGLWYEVARLPNRFQDQCAGDVTAFYALRGDGRIDVTNACRTEDGSRDEAEGVARVVAEDGSNAKLKVRFAPRILTWLPFVWGDYWVLDLADDYSYAMVGDPSREYLWFLSRTPAVGDDLFEQLRDRAAGLQFDVSALQRTPQGFHAATP